MAGVIAQNDLTCLTCAGFLNPGDLTCDFCEAFANFNLPPPELEPGLPAPTPAMPQQGAPWSAPSDMPLVNGYFPQLLEPQQQWPMASPQKAYVQDELPDNLAYSPLVEQGYHNPVDQMFGVPIVPSPQEGQDLWAQQQTPYPDAAAFIPRQAMTMMPQPPQMQPAVELPHSGRTPSPKSPTKAQKANPRYPGQGVKKRTEAGKKNKAGSTKATQLAGSMLLSLWRINMGSAKQCALPKWYNANRDNQQKCFALLGLKVTYGPVPTFTLMEASTPAVHPEEIAQLRAMTVERTTGGYLLVENKKSGRLVDENLPPAWLVLLKPEQKLDPLFQDWEGLWSQPNNQEVWEAFKARLPQQEPQG